MSILSSRCDKAVVYKKHLDILVLGSTYPRHEGDFEVAWLRESVNRLVDRGHTVQILVPSFQGLESHTIDGVPVHRYRYAPRRWEKLTHEQGAPNRIRNPFYQVLGAPYVTMGIVAAARLASRVRFDVIHAHWPFPHGPIAAAARAACGAPVVMNSHGAEYALARRKKWVRPLLRNSLLGSDRLIANSCHTAAEVKAVSGRDSTIIPYGSTVTARPTPLPRNEVSRILCAGRLIQRKGVEFIIRAMPDILARRQAVLQLTGTGDQREFLEKLTNSLGLSDYVQFLGFVSNDRLDRLYAECDVFVNPSIVDDRGDTEGLGVGAIEAFGHGRPVVASRVGGIPEVVIDGKTGFLVPEKNPAALAKAVLFVLDHPDQAAFMAKAGLVFAQTHFDWDRITDAIEEVYLDAIREVRGTQPELSPPSDWKTRRRFDTAAASEEERSIVR
jgi:glycosyltransferase involved in cell wall biosynthesis